MSSTGAETVVVVAPGDPDVTDMLRHAFAGDGATVVAARSGDELGRLLGTEGVAALVAPLAGGDPAGWLRLEMVREELPELAIVAMPESGAPGWDQTSGGCPADAVVDRPASAEDLARVVKVVTRISRPPRAEPGPAGPPCVAVAGVAGGVGTTVVSVMLAQLAGPPVLLADLDQRYGAAATALRVRPPYTVDDLSAHTADPDQLDEALSLAASPITERLVLLAGAGSPAPLREPRNLRALLGAMGRFGRHGVADMGVVADDQLDALRSADSVVLVSRQDVTSARRLGELTERLEGGPEVRAVLNRARPGSRPRPADLSAATGIDWSAVVPESRLVRSAYDDVSGRGMAFGHRRLWRSARRWLGGLADEVLAETSGEADR